MDPISVGAIDAELAQLFSLGELLFNIPDPGGYRDNFYGGLAWMIQGCAERIMEILHPEEKLEVQNG